MATKFLLDKNKIQDFQETVRRYFNEHRRNLEWRDVDSNGMIDPYHVLVSEVMLQQTQVPRVEKKYREFLTVFPTLASLAEADFSQVLSVWSGLGYNRRAKYLHDFAKVTDGKSFPQTVDELTRHKGIGKNTAAAVLIYAYNQRHVFVETNIRTVFIHHFFTDIKQVSDKDIVEVVKSTLPEGSVREWYWALMDYGTFLKRSGFSRLSKTIAYKKQSAFKGSKRELRSIIVQLLLKKSDVSGEVLQEMTGDPRTKEAIDSLLKDGLITYKDNHYRVS